MANMVANRERLLAVRSLALLTASSTSPLTQPIVVGTSQTPTRMFKCMHASNSETTNHLKDLKRSRQAGLQAQAMRRCYVCSEREAPEPVQTSCQ